MSCVPFQSPRPRLLERSVLTHCFHFLNSHSPADFLRLEFCTHSSSEIVVCRSSSPSSSWGRTGANSATLPPAPSSFRNVAQCLSRGSSTCTAQIYAVHPPPHRTPKLQPGHKPGANQKPGHHAVCDTRDTLGRKTPRRSFHNT